MKNKRLSKTNGRTFHLLSQSIFICLHFRDNLSKQLEITNVKLKTESLNLNLLQEQCAELEKEKKIMNIELDAVQKESSNRINLLDSENNTVSLSSNRIFITFSLIF